MFIGRDLELKALETMYASDRFEFVVIYGRRRVGKTALINRFIEGRKAVYFMGVESNARQNLENLSQSILEALDASDADADASVNATFDSFQTALEHVFQRARNERIVLAIDEYPYVARVSASLASTLQMLIDRYKDESKLMLILCGSSMSYMADEVLAYKSPLYGRRTAQMRIEPFDFATACKYFNRFSDEDKAVAYGIVGGTPQYLLQFDDRLSIEANLKRTLLNPASALFEEPESLLKQEVREPAIYNAIITAIATGASRLSEIAVKIGETTSVCSGYLKNLLELGLVRRESPYGEKQSRKSLYAIDDNLFRFWYRFIPRNSSVIARGAQDLAWRRIEPRLSEYMGHVFEDICIQYLWSTLLNGDCPVDFKDLGRWWGNDPTRRAQTEIDIMGEQDADTALFGECKWTSGPIDVGVLDLLDHRSRLFRYTHTRLYLFSRSGFTTGCIEKAARMGNVELVSYDGILRYHETH